jgi:hypothetical protein
MNRHDVLTRYVDLCRTAFSEHSRVHSMLRNRGITDAQILDSFGIGYADGRVLKLVDQQPGIGEHLDRFGVVASGRERLKGRITVPIFAADGGIVNVIGYSPWPNASERLIGLNTEGIFNAPFLKHATQVIFTEDPLQSLLLAQHGVANSTFLLGPDAEYTNFLRRHGISEVVFTCEGHARLFHELSDQRQLKLPSGDN